MRFVFIFVFQLFLLNACVTTGNQSGYSVQPTTIATVTLFNQKRVSKLAKTNWIGDWVFRRDRLELVDRDLRDTKPDILFMQEALEKEDSFSESDFHILAAASLKGYTVSKQETQIIEETEEHEYLAVGAGLPLQFLAPPAGQKSTWQLGADGFLAAFELSDGGQPILLFNVQMPTNNEQLTMWLSFIKERVEERMKAFNVCNRRVVIAGRIIPDQEGKRYNAFLSAFQLKDSSFGFCQNVSRCYTATPQNEIFMATFGDEPPAQADRILVSRDAIVYSSNRILDNGSDSKKYTSEYGLSRVWPSQRFGWASSVRLPLCNTN